MKNFLRKHLLSLLLGCCMAALFFSLSTQRQDIRSLYLSARASIGSEDDPEARWRYELMMLRDPKTGLIPANIRQKELEFARTLPERQAVISLGKGGGVIPAATWSPRGPFNVGGRTRALAIDASNENILLAGGVSGGMWRSTNGGNSWTRTTGLNASVQSVSCIAQDIRDGNRNIWYYGTGERKGNSASGFGAPYLGDGIYKSTDGGVAWSVLASTISGTPHVWDGDFDYVWNIATDPSNSSQDEVYAAVYGGIKRSTNGGTSWTNSQTADPGLLTGNYTDVAVTSTGVVYGTISSDASGTKGIFRSPDGITWTPITPGDWPATYARIVIGVAPSNEDVVYFLAETPGSGTKGHSFWKYTYLSGTGDGLGGTWENRSTNIPAFGGDVGDFDSQGSYDLVIKVKPNDPNVVIIGGTNLYRSTDGYTSSTNTTWIGSYATVNDISQYANHHPDQHSLAFLPSNANVLFSGHDGGISKTTDILASTVNWTSLNNGYFTSQFYTLAIDNGTSGNNVLVGGMQDNGTWFSSSTSASASWVDLFSGDGAYCAIADGRTSYYMSSQNGNTYRFLLNSSGVPQDFANVTPANATGFLFINPFTLDPNDNKFMYMAAGRTIWRNSNLTGIPLASAVGNSANNKTTVNWDSLTTSSITSGTISALAVSKSPSNRLYFGTTNGQVYRMDNVNVGSPSRTTITGSFPVNGSVSCVAVDPTAADNVLVVFSNYNVLSLFYSTNGGTNWSAVSGNLEQNPDGSGNGPSVRWGSILPLGSSKVYFVGTSTGVYSTTTLSGSSTVWVQEGSSNIGSVVVPMIVTRPLDGLVIVATHANGVFSATMAVPLSAPALLIPADGATGVPLNPSLTWSSVAGATSYTVQVSTSSSFNSFVVNQSGISNTSLALTGLQASTQYFWRVSASNTGETSSFSAARSFVTTVASSAELIDGVAPKDFQLAQNYPNPFNPSTTIRFDLPNADRVTLKIFDVSGRELSTLVNDVMRPGRYAVRWNGRDASGRDQSSGTYFYRLQTSSFSKTNRMVLLR